MANKLTPLREQRREKILDAAERLFVTDGVRATTIEGLAAAVGMSKVTVYSYFDDKDAIFAAVSDRVATRMAEVFLEALDADQSVRDRIADALVAKHRLVHELVRNSTHSRELFRAKDRTSIERFRELDRQMISAITEVLRPLEDEPGKLAKMLFDASQGIANGTSDFDTVEASIRSLVMLVANEEPDPARVPGPGKM